MGSNKMYWKRYNNLKKCYILGPAIVHYFKILGKVRGLSLKWNSIYLLNSLIA